MADYGYQSAGMIKGAWDEKAAYVGEGATAPMGPFAAVGHAFEDVHALARRVSLLADRLVGAVPQDVSAGYAANQPPPPLLTALHIEASRAAQSVRDANEALERIERLLA